MDASQLELSLASLLVYPYVFHTSVGSAFVRVLEKTHQLSLDSSPSVTLEHRRAYGEWFYQLSLQPQSWQNWIEHQVLFEPNPVAIALKGSHPLSPWLESAACQDLDILEAIAKHGPGLIRPPNAPEELGTVPQHDSFFSGALPWSTQWSQLCQHYQQHGTGVIAQYPALRWIQGRLIGIDQPDPIQLHELVGYERQKARLCRNTEALLEGYPALNVLLYGCRGTGKSALVKSLIHAYGDRGLRLVELSKADLIHLPDVVNAVRHAPQKFIFFVDDLSFEEDEERYKALKVVLEGNVTARPDNVVVYATSNRRHLVREFFEDRPRPSDADEIHSWDTVQEKLSLSDRFGLSLTFQPANQETYLQIIFHLAQLQRLTLDPEDLRFRALQWATQQNGRSGRTARQFIQALQADLNQPGTEGRFV